METLNKKCGCCNCVGIVSGILFAIIAVVHLIRAIAGWSIVIDGADFPMWASWLIVVVGAAAAGWNFCGCACKKCCHKEEIPPPPKIE